jgi:hypothetical protein
MITVTTHKTSYKSPFKHPKTIYVFTSGQVIITVQIHSRKELYKGLKWPLHNGASIPESKQQDMRYPAPRFNEKRGVCIRFVDVSK